MTAPLRRNGRRVVDIQRMCENKSRFCDDNAARAHGLWQRQFQKEPLYIYPCKLCRGWHLTRRKQHLREHAVDYYEKKEIK